MKILGIETSCDETGVAIYDEEKGLIANQLYSQIEMHADYGGVVPELASRDHIRKTVPLIEAALKEANLTACDIDGVAYTAGPGLVGALLVGAIIARSLAYAWNVPALGIHHMEGHLLAPMLEEVPPEFPFVALLISGGHTQLVKVDGVGQYELLGESIDDAAGEAFDKIARVLGYPYPGGPHIDALAKEGNPNAIDFPRPLLEKGNFDFSFSGLKSAVLNYINGKQQKGESICHEDVAASFQKAITDVLVEKMKEAAHTLGETKIALAGGVSANSGLQRDLQAMCEAEGLTYLTAGSMLATDNAAMIGCRAYYMAQAGKFSNYTLNAKPSIPLGSDLWKGNQHD